MKDRWVDLIVTLVGIGVIVWLEMEALKRGIDGVSLTVAVALIALLLPSPSRWLIRFKDTVIEKSRQNGDAPRE